MQDDSKLAHNDHDHAPGHNTIRFDLTMCDIYSMVESGEVKMSDLIQKIRKAITDVIDRETEWQEFPGGGYVRFSGGDGSGRTGTATHLHPIHDECIVYDFS